MNDPRIILQTKLFQHLSTLLAGVATVRDGGDPTGTLPLIIIGEDRLEDDGTKDDFFTGDIVHTFHVFTDAQKAEGTLTNKTIQQTIYSSLHQNPPTLTGGVSCYECQVETGEVFRDLDYPVWHGVMELRFSF